MGLFNLKHFNAEVFGKYVNTVSDLRRNELLKSGALVERKDLAKLFPEQTGGNFATIPFKAAIGGEPVLYDGSTDITASERNTYSQGIVVIGRAKGFVERDFSSDITGGVDFLPVAEEVAHYWDNVDQDTLLAILEGIFKMSDVDSLPFVSNHTLDISERLDDNQVDATTLNSAIQKALGDNKNAFSVAIMHSAVATNLENLNLLNYLKYTDSQGVQRDLQLATWNGRAVLIDDSVPVVVETEDDVDITKYTTYILGKGAFDYADLGVAVPYEMDRDPAKNGGETTLYTRQRKIFAPRGISFLKENYGAITPSTTNLRADDAWALVKDASGNPINHKHIPIARIISRG